MKGGSGSGRVLQIQGHRGLHEPVGLFGFPHRLQGVSAEAVHGAVDRYG